MTATAGGSAPGPVTVGIDIGGSKVHAGLVDATGAVLAETWAATPDPEEGPGAVEVVLVDAVRGLRADHPSLDVRAVGVGAAGLVDSARGVVRHSAHVAWRDEPLRDRLTGRLALPVLVENDATAAAWAEHAHGAGRDATHLLYVALGTGIGGAFFVDGHLVRGRAGLAGELGHVQVVPDGRPCPCGRTGCWERYCSGSALQILDGRPGPAVVAAAADGDDVARAALAEVGRWLGVGLTNLVAVLDPDVVVLGGGLGVPAVGLLEPAADHLATHVLGAGHRDLPELRYAALGPAAGMLGAADLARALV